MIEPRPAVSPTRPRCKTLNVRTMEHLRRWGIADRLREQAPRMNAAFSAPPSLRWKRSRAATHAAAKPTTRPYASTVIVVVGILRTDLGCRAPRRPHQRDGCKQVTTRRHRRSGRVRVASPASQPERALSAEAAERVARAMLARSEGRTWEPHRDAILLRCEFGLGLRPEEIAAARWRALARPTPRGDWVLIVDNALSHGRVTGVKTTERSKRVPPIVRDWLTQWRDVARAHGIPTSDESFIVPGASGDGHFTLNQHKKWGGRYFRPAAETVAKAHLHLSHLGRATPCAARRGHITCRILAGEPAQVIARSCGTSPATIHRHYFVAIDAAERGDLLPPFEQQLADAVAVTSTRGRTRGRAGRMQP